MKWLYDFGIRTYGIGSRVMALRNEKARLFVDGRRNALDNLRALTEKNAPEGYDYWFHAASLGEFEQARPLIEKLKETDPKLKILLSFFSPSGYKVRHNYEYADAVVYLPADSRKNAKTFLDIARPRHAVFVKYEFWLNFLDALKDLDIPTYLISAIFRPSQHFFKWYGGTFRKRLECYTHLFVQDANSLELLKGIGVNHVSVTGDTRFDRVHRIMTEGKTFEAIEHWCNETFTLVAGSSWPKDEEKYLSWINSHPEVKVIIAPHEFDAQRIERLRAQLKQPSQLWSETEIESPTGLSTNTQTLIVNTFGKLSSLYRYASAVIIGGGFGAGIHNINEAAVYGVPVIFGPNNKKFKEASDLKTLGGGFEFHTSSELSELLDRMVEDSTFLRTASESAGRYIKENLGATDAIFDMITCTSPI